MNHASFYKDHDGAATVFIDIDIQNDYMDLTRYTGHSPDQQFDINVFDQKAVFKFWQKARSHRAQHPLPEVGSVHDFNQLIHFNPNTLDDDDSQSDTDSQITVIPNLLEITIPEICLSENESVASLNALPLSTIELSSDDSVTHEVSFNEVHDGSFEQQNAPEPVMPVAELNLTAPPAEDSQLSQPVSDRQAHKIIKNINNPGDTVPIDEYLDMVDFHATTIDQINSDNAKKTAELVKDFEAGIARLVAEKKELTDSLTELTDSDEKWRSRATKEREDLIFMINSSAAAIEVVSAGLSLHNLSVTRTDVKHASIIRPGSSQDLHQIRVVEQPSQIQPRCSNRCLHNALQNVLVLCETCQFIVSGSAAIGILNVAIERTRFVPCEFVEGHSKVKKGLPRPAKVVVVTELTEGTKRKMASRKIIVARRKVQPPPSEASDGSLDEEQYASPEKVLMPDLGQLNDFDQSTTKFSLDQIRSRDVPKWLNIKDAITKCDCSEFEIASEQCFCEEYGHKTRFHEQIVKENEDFENSAGLKIMTIAKALIEQQDISYNEACLQIKISQPQLYARWEAERAEIDIANEAKFGPKVQISGDKFQAGPDASTPNKPEIREARIMKFGINVDHHTNVPPKAAFQLVNLVKQKVDSGLSYSDAVLKVKATHKSLVEMAEKDAQIKAAKSDPSDNDEFFSCPEN